MPLLDFINHSFEPNVTIMPFNDKISNQSFIKLQALREI
jgi:hypothetical protein